MQHIKISHLVLFLGVLTFSCKTRVCSSIKIDSKPQSISFGLLEKYQNEFNNQRNKFDQTITLDLSHECYDLRQLSSQTFIVFANNRVLHIDTLDNDNKFIVQNWFAGGNCNFSVWIVNQEKTSVLIWNNDGMDAIPLDVEKVNIKLKQESNSQREIDVITKKE
jgi:hypothetical protein